MIESIIFLLIIIAFYGVGYVIQIIRKLIPEEKRQQKIIKKLQKIIENDKSQEFNRQNYSEAFADNFARMYGYGSSLISALGKMQKDLLNNVNSRYKLETKRENALLNIAISMLDDEHKTDIHRIKSLLDEYKTDIEDPNTPPEVKKMLEDDVKEVKLVLNKYLNDMGGLQNKINKTIADSLELLDDENEDEEIHEESYYKPLSVERFENFSRGQVRQQIRECGHPIIYDTNEYFESGLKFHIFSGNELESAQWIIESRKAYEKMMDDINRVTSSERSEFYKIFGKSNACSLAKDKDGYYVRTHRARSKSYDTIDKIPKKDVNFVRSTS